LALSLSKKYIKIKIIKINQMLNKNKMTPIKLNLKAMPIKVLPSGYFLPQANMFFST